MLKNSTYIIQKIKEHMKIMIFSLDKPISENVLFPRTECQSFGKNNTFRNVLKMFVRNNLKYIQLGPKAHGD